jgi:hypothetical protein
MWTTLKDGLRRHNFRNFSIAMHREMLLLQSLLEFQAGGHSIRMLITPVEHPVDLQDMFALSYLFTVIKLTWVDQVEDIARVSHNKFGRCETNNGNDVKAGPTSDV